MYMYLLIYIHILINTYNYMRLCKLVSVFSPNSLIFSLGCCARLPGLVSQLVSQSPSLFFTLVLSLSCLPTCLPVSQLVLQPGMLCPAPWSCVRSCLPSCLPVCQLVLQPGMLCPAPWSCVCLVSQLVSQSPSLFFSLGCCVRLPGLVSELVSQSASLFFSLGCCVRLPGLVFVLFPVLSLNLSPSLPACSSAWDAVSGSLVLCLSCLPVSQLVLQPGMLCPAPWSCVCLVSQLVSQSPSLFFSLGCCVRLPGLVSGLVSHLVFQLVSVVWACLKNFLCDLCNCLGSTVV